MLTVTGCLFSNKGSGLLADMMGILNSHTNTGTGNTSGLSASQGGRIAKTATQPGGPETTTGGGQILSLAPSATDANITLYVRTDGIDSNDGSANDAAHALRTIQAAINRIPQIVNHSVTINVADGVYGEDVSLLGYSGKGSIFITGNIATPTNVSISSAVITRCSLYVEFKGFNLTIATTTPAITVNGCIYLLVKNCAATAAKNDQIGINISFSTVQVSNCTVSNKGYALWAVCCRVNSDNNAGTGNLTGMSALYAATVGKSGTQFSGTTAESTSYGGVIR
jgi:hypothetical protein